VAEGRQFRQEPTVHCDDCPAHYLCDERLTEYGCHNEYVPPEQGGRDILHPRRPDLSERLWEVGGLDIRLRNVAPGPVPALPPYIPCVEPRAGFHSPPCSVVAVPLDRVRPTGPATPAADMKAKLGLPSDAIMIVTCFQHDHILERVWRCRRRFVDSMAVAGYNLVTSPNYSLWLGDTRLEHRHNIRRSIIIFESLADAGVATIPHVYWLLDRDVDDWIAALSAWPGARMFSLDLTTLGVRGWNEGIRGLRRLVDGIGDDWEVLVNGVAKHERVTQVSNICGHIHLTNSHAFQLAMSQRLGAQEFPMMGVPLAPRTKMERFTAELEMAAETVPAASECRLPLSPSLAVDAMPSRARALGVP
jgi:hypothetical protein